MKIKLPALAAILLAAVSCLHTGRWEKLCDVETYVYEHPDSALQVQHRTNMIVALQIRTED